jgi:hypothetical protein
LPWNVRITKLADRIYAYEQVDPTKRIVTVNNLIVITSRGVLVCDGQGTVDNTTRLVADIAKLTPQPIVYVVVASEHADHTAGNSAFPASAVFMASAFSRANLEQQANAANQRANAPKTIVSTETVSGKRVLSLGDTEVRSGTWPRAYERRSCRLSAKEKILWMSEVFSIASFRRWPTASQRNGSNAQQGRADGCEHLRPRARFRGQSCHPEGRRA